MKENNEVARLSLDNGATFIDDAELPSVINFPRKYGVRWETIEAMMDDNLRESIHCYLAPCTELDFLREYLRRAEEDLIIG